MVQCLMLMAMHGMWVSTGTQLQFPRSRLCWFSRGTGGGSYFKGNTVLYSLVYVCI